MKIRVRDSTGTQKQELDTTHPPIHLRRDLTCSEEENCVEKEPKPKVFKEGSGARESIEGPPGVSHLYMEQEARCKLNDFGQQAHRIHLRFE